MEQKPAKMWETEIWAVDPKVIEHEWLPDARQFTGPTVPGATIKEAQEYCNKNGLGYCRVTNEVKSEK